MSREFGGGQENDIALLNVYFGESTAMGKYESYWKGFGYSYSEYERSLKRTNVEILVDMAAWFGEKSILSLLLTVFRGLFGHKRSLPG